MSTKQVFAVVAYILAICVPAGAMAIRFGFDTDVDLSNSHTAVEQLLSISGAVISGFVLSIFAGRLLIKESESMLQVVGRLLSELLEHDSAGHRTRTT